jgi:ligand-binding SRPBCC domain-containing protein
MGVTELTCGSLLPVASGDALGWHARPWAFEPMTPPRANAAIEEAHGSMAPGDWRRLRVRVGAVGPDWTMSHLPLSGAGGVNLFRDEQCAGPFRARRHEYRFADTDGSTFVFEDGLAHRLSLGPLGDPATGGRVKRQLDEGFGCHNRRTEFNLLRHAEVRGLPLGIAVSGSPGLAFSDVTSTLPGSGRERPRRHGGSRRHQAGNGIVRFSDVVARVPENRACCADVTPRNPGGTRVSSHGQ